MAACKVEIPDGWEQAFDEMRVPREGETYLVPRDGSVCVCMGPGYGPRIIVRSTWPWPAWLKSEWIVMDNTSHWWATNDIPTLTRHGTLLSRGSLLLSHNFLAFDPPPSRHWSVSARRNPNWPS